MVEECSASQELRALAQELRGEVAAFHSDGHWQVLQAVEGAVKQVARAWSGSWIGYQANVYVKEFRPPGSRWVFSHDWGFDDPMCHSTYGDWVEYDGDIVKQAVLDKAGSPDLEAARRAANAVYKKFRRVKEDVLSLLGIFLGSRSDAIVALVATEVKDLKYKLQSEFVSDMAPKILKTRDARALQRGCVVPPHIDLQTMVYESIDILNACGILVNKCYEACRHMDRLARMTTEHRMSGKRVFIGHGGGSGAWKELRDYLQYRLNLEWDEFNRVATPGVSTVQRLSDMLNEAVLAFVVLTAEDETKDGQMQARMNVIHEVGLFQGRLGFDRAIVVLEEGCQEFSNIQGLGQIRFPRGRIDSKFDEIRRVLEDRGIIR